MQNKEETASASRRLAVWGEDTPRIETVELR